MEPTDTPPATESVRGVTPSLLTKESTRALIFLFISIAIAGYIVYGGVSIIDSRPETPRLGVAQPTKATDTSAANTNSTPDYHLYTSFYDGQANTLPIYENLGVVAAGKYAGYTIVGAVSEAGVDYYTIGLTGLFATKDFMHFTADTSTSTRLIFSKQSFIIGTDGKKDSTEFSDAVVGVDDLGLQTPPPSIDEGNFTLVLDQLVPGYVASSTAPSVPVDSNLTLFTNGDAYCYEPSLVTCTISYYLQTPDKLFYQYHLVTKESLARAPDHTQDRYAEYFNPWYVASDFVAGTPTYQSYVLVAPRYFYGSKTINGSYVNNDVPITDDNPVLRTKRGVQLDAPKSVADTAITLVYNDLKGKRQSVAEDHYGDPTIANNIVKWVNGKKMTVPFPLLTDYGKNYPVLFFADPWGNWYALKEDDYDPEWASEKGKPVIYLYPTHTENVSVKVDPVGGFTKTEPAYGNGWKVKATPESVLTNLSDGKIYPYLFWEGGAKGVVKTPKEGFVVAQKDIPSLLDDKLAQLGLTPKEAADFKEFWVPRLSKAPYYFITFVPKSEMDRVAPLTITPTPDTVIRVLMDYRALQSLETVAPLQIETPKRTGFTVVEWGGILRD